MIKAKQDLDRVREFYTARRPVGRSGASIYEIWEKGGAFNDSITPSTYVPEYRSHMVLKLLSLTACKQKIFSLGCGNGFVEGFECAEPVSLSFKRDACCPEPLAFGYAPESCV